MISTIRFGGNTNFKGYCVGDKLKKLFNSKTKAILWQDQQTNKSNI